MPSNTSDGQVEHNGAQGGNQGGNQGGDQGKEKDGSSGYAMERYFWSLLAAPTVARS